MIVMMLLLLNLCVYLNPNRKPIPLLSQFTKKAIRDAVHFDVSKCDRILDEMLKNGYIKLSHPLRPLDEL